MKNKKSKYITLNKKIIISFSIPILIFILILYTLINIAVKTKFKEYVTLKEKHTIENIDFNLHKSYIDDRWDISRLINTGEELLSNGIILKIEDKNGNYIWSMYECDSNKCKTVLNEIKNSMKKTYPLWNDKMVEEKAPIYDDENKLIGYRVLNYYEDRVYMNEELTFIDTIQNTFIVFTIVSIIILFVITVSISKNISNPIKKVSYITKNIEKGDYHSLKYDGDIKEVNNLIISINNLSSTLENQEHIRKRLITDISHELSNPLTSIHGHLRAMIDGIWNPTVHRLISIDTEILRIIELIKNLKSLNVLENNSISKEKVNLKELINASILNLEASAVEKNITIKHDLDDVIASVDKSKITQVIVNILSNAIKYTNTNGKIDIKLYKNNSKIYISIKDNGIGIDQDEIKYIFERFYRVNNSTVFENDGLGVGLSICKYIINKHNGEIEVISELGKGSEFIIKLNSK